MLEDLATHYIKWLSFRIYNEAKHNNAILIKKKNAVAASDVATRTDLIKSKETEAEKASVSMSVIVEDEVDLNRFKRRRSDRWHLKDISMQKKYEKKMRKFNVYWYCSIRRITIYQDFEADLINKVWKVMKE